GARPRPTHCHVAGGDAYAIRDSPPTRFSGARNSAAERVAIRKCKPRPGATYTVAGFCARYVNEPAENCCAQLTEQTRSREYKSSDQCDHERKQHKVTQKHGHTYALFFKRQSFPPKDLPSAPCAAGDIRLNNFCGSPATGDRVIIRIDLTPGG